MLIHTQQTNRAVAAPRGAATHPRMKASVIAALRQLVIARGTFLEAEEDHVDFLEIQLGFDPQIRHRRKGARYAV